MEQTLSSTTMLIRNVNYWLSDHPTILNFRWTVTQTWGSTWLFLITSIFFYTTASLVLHHILSLLLNPRRSVPIGPIPALHSLTMALVSLTIFAGAAVSSAAEIRETRWLWHRSKTPLQWFLCFPLGTRPSGRVFFWSYIFYISRFLLFPRTFFTILRHRAIPLYQLLMYSLSICTSFVWLEFSQSFHVLEILSITLIDSIIYGYKFWTSVGLRRANFPLVTGCRAVLIGCNCLCHFGVLSLHFRKGGCNGIGAWAFNSVVHTLTLVLFLNFCLRMRALKRKVAAADESINAKDKDL